MDGVKLHRGSGEVRGRPRLYNTFSRFVSFNHYMAQPGRDVPEARPNSRQLNVVEWGLV